MSPYKYSKREITTSALNKRSYIKQKSAGTSVNESLLIRGQKNELINKMEVSNSGRLLR